MFYPLDTANIVVTPTHTVPFIHPARFMEQNSSNHPKIDSPC